MDASSRSGVAAHDFEIAYGPARENVIEVWEGRSPANGAQLVVIHGGFWRAAYTRRHIRRLCAALASEVNTVYSIEYSRCDGTGTGWPHTFRDVASAVDACISNAVSSNPQGRVVLLGHSAGGQLALWAASRHRVTGDLPGLTRGEATSCVGVIALAGVCDLRMASRLALGNRAVDHLIGGDPRVYPERFAVADPSRLVPAGISTILVHGASDTTVPLDISTSYATRARAAGDRCDLRVLQRTGHFALINPHSHAWPHVLSAVAELARGGRPAGRSTEDDPQLTGLVDRGGVRTTAGAAPGRVVTQERQRQ